ncbi:uncharacterized protein [Petaurus breviceps papuanus]|uniref:zinc finger Ran-binding domain-containing protein 2 isoform X1 n=1 Tax=Petaurus breviceps papuanus TaxID=3040969 RepID=UPI0036DC61CC
MSTKNFRVSDGDWICPDKKCGNVNFARRTSCNRCGREKTTEAKMMKAGGTEIGKTLAEKSRGLFSANDWQCKTCSNVNWARRSECNMCNTPKYAKLEERTGYGGGFNERENVEYIEREESDGEYDEFGRKKKKYRGKAVGPASILKEVEDKESEGEEEDEDEDLSKYKLDEMQDRVFIPLMLRFLSLLGSDGYIFIRMRTKMMPICQNIILMPVKRKTATGRGPEGGAAPSPAPPAPPPAPPPTRAQGLGPGPVQEAPPAPGQGLGPVPENSRDLVGRNPDPAPGPTGGLPPHEKELIQVPHHLLREAENEVVLDPLHPVIAKKDAPDHGHPKGAAGHRLDHPIRVPVQALKRNNVLKFTPKKIPVQCMKHIFKKFGVLLGQKC